MAGLLAAGAAHQVCLFNREHSSMARPPERKVFLRERPAKYSRGRGEALPVEMNGLLFFSSGPVAD